MSFKTRVDNLYNQLFLTEQVAAADIARINNRRVLMIVKFLIPIHLGFIIVAWLSNQWQAGIIYAHLIMLIFITLVGLTTLKESKNKGKDSFFRYSVAPVLATAYLFFGAALYVLDEPLVSGLNPFLITSIAVAAIIILKPEVSAFLGCSFTGKMEDLKITASCGVAPTNQDQKATFESVYQKANRALSSAKNKGQNRVEAAC